MASFLNFAFQWNAVPPGADPFTSYSVLSLGSWAEADSGVRLSPLGIPLRCIQPSELRSSTL